MAFDVSAISAWTNEIADKSEWILKPILGTKTLQSLSGIDKRMGITGYTDKLPTLESTTPWQAGASCGFNTSGSTTINQISLTTVPIKIQEQICLQDLETYFAHAVLPKNNSRPETFQLLDLWVNRKLQQAALQIESALWQAKTTYTNATHLKLFNGWISAIDGASPIAATQQASISTSTVRGIMEEIAYTKIPSKIRGLNPVVVCGQDTFNIYMNKLMVDNLYHYDPSNKDLSAYETNIFGTNTKLIGLPGLNNDNAVDTGALPTAVKNRIFATYQDNLLLGMNAENDIKDFDVWFSKDDQVLKFYMRFFLGVNVKYGDLIVQYTNS